MATLAEWVAALGEGEAGADPQLVREGEEERGEKRFPYKVGAGDWLEWSAAMAEGGVQLKVGQVAVGMRAGVRLAGGGEPGGPGVDGGRGAAPGCPQGGGHTAAQVRSAVAAGGHGGRHQVCRGGVAGQGGQAAGGAGGAGPVRHGRHGGTQPRRESAPPDWTPPHSWTRSPGCSTYGAPGTPTWRGCSGLPSSRCRLNRTL